jgi:hypothetical protein
MWKKLFPKRYLQKRIRTKKNLNSNLSRDLRALRLFGLSLFLVFWYKIIHLKFLSFGNY